MSIITVVRGKTLEPVSDTDELMEAAGLDPRMGYEDVGIQGDGSLVVFDRCGCFGYLPPDLYQPMLNLGQFLEISD